MGSINSLTEERGGGNKPFNGHEGDEHCAVAHGAVEEALFLPFEQCAPLSHCRTLEEVPHPLVEG
eukprot:m.136985 g.136985  ORF g.136985 m.136985 type:complete len:65 (-) comp11117_c0_seq1:1582-1776(-)